MCSYGALLQTGFVLFRAERCARSEVAKQYHGFINQGDPLVLETLS